MRRFSVTTTSTVYPKISNVRDTVHEEKFTESCPKISPQQAELSSDLTKEGNNTGALLIAISELNKFGIKLEKFPNIAVVGPQSSGKSSLIEGLCGRSILPKKNDMATKKPCNIVTIKSDERKFKIRGDVVFSEKEAADLIDRHNENPSVKEIDVEIHSPELYNSRFTDLPGLYYVSGKSGNKDQPRIIKEMNEEYIRDPNNIPLVVSSAASDPATNQAIQIVNDLGRSDDSLGILTKIDLTKRQDTHKFRDMLSGKLEDYAMGFGWIATVLRSQKEVDDGMTVKQKEDLEQEYFKKHPEFSPCGIDTIRRRISDIQFHRIKNNVPKMLEEVNSKLEDLKHSGTFLGQILVDPKNRLVGRLQIMIEKLVGSSLERAEFEEQLRNDFSKAINKYMEQAISPKESYVPEYAGSVDRSIMKYHSDSVSNPKNYMEDTFGNLFRYGLVSPIVADNDAIQTAFKYESSLATTLPMIFFVKDDPLGKKRLQWNKFLTRFFGALLQDNNIQQIVYDLTEKRILDYIKADSEGTTDGISHKFSEYIVREIGSKAYAENIQFSITSMINTEKRPNVSPVELARELSQMYPEVFIFTGSTFETFTRKNQKLKVEVYGEEFNEAYLRAVSRKLGDNIYRNVAVNLLDNMVLKLLEMTIDMFNQESIQKETLRVNDKIKRLEGIKSILTKFT